MPPKWKMQSGRQRLELMEWRFVEGVLRACAGAKIEDERP